MKVIRPGRTTDLDSLMRLAHSAGPGLTTLPPSEEVLGARLLESEQAYAKQVTRPRGELYMLVMEDLLTAKVVGCSGILSRVGGFDPFYSYEIRRRVHESKALGVRKEVESLHLVANHTGPSEIGSLYLHPDARGGGNGRLLSLSRFLLMASSPERFATEVIAEMRGVLDEHQESPFWNAVGRHFFEIDFVTADRRSAGNKEFIAELMAEHPIYLPLLPKSAQAVVGQVHPDTEPALRLLQQEGFTFGGEVDIFDAGPTYRAELARVRTLRDSRVGVFDHIAEPGAGTDRMLVANNVIDFRATMGAVHVSDEGGVGLPRDVALALGLHLGDTVRYVSARTT